MIKRIIQYKENKNKMMCFARGRDVALWGDVMVGEEEMKKKRYGEDEAWKQVLRRENKCDI